MGQLVLNRPFFEDEAAFAFSLSTRPFSQLFSALDFGRVAPVGFVFLEKVATNVLGDFDWAYRVVPAAASLCLIYQVWKLSLDSSRKTFLVLMLFLNPFFLRYTVEAKPYIVDALVAMLLLRYLLKKQFSALPLVLGAGVWFSYTPLIALVPVTVISFSYRNDAEFSLKAWAMGVSSIVFNYLATLYGHSNRQSMTGYWEWFGGVFVSGHNYPRFVYHAVEMAAVSFKSVSDLLYLSGIKEIGALVILTLIVISVRSEVGRLTALLLASHVVFATLRLYPVDERLMLVLCRCSVVS